MLAVLTAGMYIFIYCSEKASAMMYKAADEINGFIDSQYSAIAQKLPMDRQIIIEV